MTASPASRDRADQARADLADLIDRQMSPLGLAAMDALAPARGQTVLDVGCGAGETVLQLADRVGPAGRVIGIDIAPRVLAVARARTAHLPHVTLMQGDAAALALPDRSVDAVYSRFGVMGFDDPVAAFANLHRLLRRGGRIGFVCWRSMRENELDCFPVDAAGLAAAVDGTPFRFAQADAIAHVLHAAGFDAISVDAHDAPVSSGDADAMLAVVTQVGALGQILRERPDLKPGAAQRVGAALAARAQDGSVSLGAATWIVGATA